MFRSLWKWEMTTPDADYIRWRQMVARRQFASPCNLKKDHSNSFSMVYGVRSSSNRVFTVGRGDFRV
jgi:hypothetical protein